MREGVREGVRGGDRPQPAVGSSSSCCRQSASPSQSQRREIHWPVDSHLNSSSLQVTSATHVPPPPVMPHTHTRAHTAT